jgi:hypothetical protein
MESKVLVLNQTDKYVLNIHVVWLSRQDAGESMRMSRCQLLKIYGANKQLPSNQV